MALPIRWYYGMNVAGPVVLLASRGIGKDSLAHIILIALIMFSIVGKWA